ncbi:hypothetical protein CLAFUW4_04682 [Fulvia fulva]|uniref:Uncharacterized protein n=1 Tax=Passalora fulva TaxID=5499 RepID=A0A9Q8LFI4_PASFU|nr:uncharacterized protein CLAFUR5_04643 [Fulvia fulva]KAK4626703.1 hypothetical protein CLAFUR4_04668 [Fulvia fulva]KAK4628011.1 hypothetical protein CLAFUR0_04672 [Fulvia fulva]UJO16452.1 hypothetical protein CLAFUR5_04643 [Fulvia fulva]WPV13639.1 hypothetical protein CLAFUW4_04682 [Fulvia fulva]WPV29298.1 hypothetical protein CLAFUW7_04676 [Fulvia fulva]
MAAIQLNFTLRTSANCKTVHLLGSWDGYKGQLPLSKDSTKTGGWKGTFRFQGQTLKQGQRYWYYYIIDGYHVSHDPARESVTEPTTGRKLNVLDIPNGKPAPPAIDTAKAARHSRRTSTGVPKGRPLSQSEIVSPRPYKPQETRKVRTENFRQPTLEQLSAKFAQAQIEEDSEESSDDDSDVESDVPSLSSRSSNSSTPSSVSSTSSCCTCERYGITRAGARVKLDCGGSRCGYSDGSECSSESEDDYRKGTTRRHGVVVRH